MCRGIAAAEPLPPQARATQHAVARSWRLSERRAGCLRQNGLALLTDAMFALLGEPAAL